MVQFHNGIRDGSSSVRPLFCHCVFFLQLFIFERWIQSSHLRRCRECTPLAQLVPPLSEHEIMIDRSTSNVGFFALNNVKISIFSLLQAPVSTLCTASYLTLWYAVVRAYIKLRRSLIIHFPTSLQTRLPHQYLRAIHCGVKHLIDTLHKVVR